MAQRILSTGSFTGFHSSPAALTSPSYYLSAVSKHAGHQPFCGNLEGWGPLSPSRYDFTPCFMDVWVSAVAGYGILFGAGAVWWLASKRARMRGAAGRGWGFGGKMVRWFLFLCDVTSSWEAIRKALGTEEARVPGNLYQDES